MRAIIHRELEKQRIREEIITYELQRRRILEAEVRRELNIRLLFFFSIQSDDRRFRFPNESTT